MAFNRQCVLERVVRFGYRLPDVTGRNLCVLCRDRLEDHIRREVADAHGIRVEPYTHAVASGSHDTDGADTRQTRQFVRHVEAGVVAQVQPAVSGVTGA